METPVLAIEGIIAEADFLPDFFGFEETQTSAKEVKDWLTTNQDAEHIKLYIDSPGGTVNEGFKIYDLLKDSGKTMECEIYQAGSIATVISLAADKENRWISDHATFHIHNSAYDPEKFFSSERWTGKELEEMAEELKQTDGEILEHYIKHLGEDKREELINLMAEDKDLGAQKAIDLGFCTGFIQDRSKSPANLVLNEAIINRIKSKKMSKEGNTQESMFKSIMDKLNNITGSRKEEPQNLNATTTEGTKLVVEENEEGEITGQTAYIADEEGNATEEVASEGEHTLEDGRVLTIDSEGTVTEVQEADPNNQTEAEKQVEELQNKLSEKEEENRQLNEKLQNQTSQINIISEEMKELKNLVPGVEGEAGKGKRKGQASSKKTAEELKNMSYSERVAYNLKQKKNLK